MNTTKMPESLAAHQPDYRGGAWDEYTIAELGSWVHLLAKRATHRTNPEKRAKDITDAQNYLSVIQAKLDALKG
jgi:hypothetical protein